MKDKTKKRKRIENWKKDRRPYSTKKDERNRNRRGGKSHVANNPH